MVYVKFQFVYACMFASTTKMGSQLLRAFISSKVLLGEGSEKAFNEYLGVRIAFPSAAEVQIWLLIFIQHSN